MRSSDVESMVLQPFTVQLANRDQTKPCGNNWDLKGMLRTDCSGEARLALHVPTPFMTIIFSLKSCNAKGDSSCSSYLQKTPGGQPGDLPPPAWQQSAEHAARRAELTSYHICCSASDTGQCPFGQAAAAAGQTLLTSTCTSQWHPI